MIRPLLRLEALAEMLYPRQCAECEGAPGDGYRYLCWDCASRLDLLHEPMCSRCGEPVAGRIDAAFVCHLCLDADRQFTRARSVARFDGVVRTLIHGFKYERSTWLAGDLVRLLASGWEVHFQDVDVNGVGWVPLHPTRRRTRGFNQARVLAEGLAARCGLPVVPGAVRRDRATTTQTNLNTRQRAENVSGAFSCPHPGRIAGKRLLVIDDVMTTGATVSEISEVLLAAGAAAVYVLTVARG